MQKLLEIKNLKKHFFLKEGIFSSSTTIKAVDCVSFDIKKGETIGLVGESGCGKTTLGRMILRLLAPTGGGIFYEGENILNYDKQRLRAYRKKAQIIFQDPFASLNPKMTIGQILEEPLIIHNAASAKERKKQAARLLDLVGLEPSFAGRYPHEFSGGQRQRINIARALSLNPEFIVADEPVSALDISIQAQIINLLREVQKKFALTYLFISHDLAVVKHITDKIMVMYQGKIVEEGPTENIFEKTQHPYTKLLIKSIPKPSLGKERL